MQSTLPVVEKACETAIRRWFEDRADPRARQHIDSCCYCKDFVDGDDGCTVETMKAMLEEIRGTDRTQRRRKFLVGMAGAVLLCMSSFGVGVYAERAQPSIYDRIEIDIMTSLDRAYAAAGVSGIQNLLAVGTNGQVKEVLHWLIARQHTPLYSDLVAHATHSNQNVAMLAISGICSVNPVDLTPHVIAIQAVVMGESDVEVQAALNEVVQNIQNP